MVETTEYFEKQQQLKASIKSTLMMPLIYMIVAVGVGIFLMVGVMPQFEGMYASLGGDLPGVTMLFMNVGNFLRALRFIYKKSHRLQTLFSYIAVKMPIFGELVKLNNLSRIASTIAQLLKNHVPLQDSLDTTRGTLDNKVYKNLLVKAQKNVMNGEYMSTAFEHHYASEVIFTRMMSVGERTGDLGKM
ncbi:type II secretion system F family protein, partial [Methanocalculus natronophilus]|uniref:type II secretion system F family protein n=1 Tax=Methanocalculus natronophilus TaxID=1262400 RepID=UPI0031B5D607